MNACAYTTDWMWHKVSFYEGVRILKNCNGGISGGILQILFIPTKPMKKYSS